MTRWFAGALVAVLAFGAGAAWAADVIGHVKTIQGGVTVVRDAPVPASVGLAILAEDVIETGSDGSVGITFTDGSTMALGPDSRLLVAEYSFDSAAFTGDFAAELSAGTLVVDAGDIARTAPDAMRITTPDAVLGVRGTVFAVKVEPRS
jgi:hypothetical protein